MKPPGPETGTSQSLYNEPGGIAGRSRGREHSRTSRRNSDRKNHAMTDPHEFHRNRASFRWALGALADALDEFDLPAPREIAVRDDSDRVHVIVSAQDSTDWCDELAGLTVEGRVPLSERLDGTHYDAKGRLGAVRVMVTWYDPSPRELPRPSLAVVEEPSPE